MQLCYFINKHTLKDEVLEVNFLAHIIFIPLKRFLLDYFFTKQTNIV